MDQGHSSLNTSSLIDLKAELHKKYESFRNTKIKQNNAQLPKNAQFKLKGEIPKEKKLKQNIIKPNKVDCEEELALKKSRENLEKKAKLYEKIISNNILLDDEEKDNYLVDFQRKVLYSTQEPVTNEDNHNVEKVADSFSPINNFRLQEISETSDNCKQKDATLNHSDQPIHYQNIHFNEVRDHGTGYFEFSMDENERKQQMEELNSLRQETEEKRFKGQKLQMKRKAMLQARLKKVCERKNIDPSILESHTKELKVDEIQTEDTQIDLSSIPLPEIEIKADFKQPVEKKAPKIRPWDVGKNDLHFVPEKRIKTQNEWIETKRGERPEEFAPPSFYKNFK